MSVGEKLHIRLAEVTAERDALATHVERLKSVERDETEYGRIIIDILDQTPATSLARLKAEWQAEALEEFGANWGWGEYRPDHKDIRQCVKRLRRQAEGGE